MKLPNKIRILLAQWPAHGLKTVYVQPLKYKIKSYITANTKRIGTTGYVTFKT